MGCRIALELKAMRLVFLYTFSPETSLTIFLEIIFFKISNSLLIEIEVYTCSVRDWLQNLKQEIAKYPLGDNTRDLSYHRSL